MRKRIDPAPLWVQFKEQGSHAARQQLIELFLPLVPLTRKRRLSRQSGEFAEELEAEGRWMLVRCVDEFDTARGVAFPSYAITKIWGAMSEFLRREDWTPRSERAKERHGEPALIREVVSLEWLSETTDDANPLCLIDRIPDLSVPVEAQVIAKMERELVRGLVRWLPARERRILFAYYWTEDPRTEIAAAISISGSLVCQIHQEALNRLRGWLTRAEASCG